ncbi:MAG: NAD(P)/FAD-dependent oxidoreductase [candidate division WOR-3 bacterium]|nr:MAG: NAD(P)/FAD-dependent oxidoreductase [candidate division WOR-3 bacterium]
MRDDYDVIVIGAGPAGSAAAAAASARGLTVLVMEEHAEIGQPLACAEGLSRSTIKGYLEIRPEWISQGLSGSIIRGPDGREFTMEYPEVGWILDRKVFDPALAKIAESKGATIKKSTKAIGIEKNEVIVKENGKGMSYFFKYLIGADGVVSKVGRWMGLDTRMKPSEIEICAEYRLKNINVKSGYAYLIFGNEYAPGGYAWIFPKSMNSANVGLGISPLRTKEKPKTLLDRWVEKEFPDAKIEERIFGAVPAKTLKTFSGNNFCLVGDAARFTDPLSGGGIANGIKSGAIAGRNAADIIRGRKNNLQAEMRAAVLDEVVWHKRVQDVYSKLDDRDLQKIFDIGERIFRGKTVTDINTQHLVRQILLASPHLLGLGFRLLL